MDNQIVKDRGASVFKTNPVKLKKLLDDIEDLKIQLPDFQRGWVWDDDRIRGLLASISRAFPVGAIMTLQSGGEISFRARPIESVESNGSVAPDTFLLDGQQRLTSLYQALRHSGPVDTHDIRGKKIKRYYYVDMQKAMDQQNDREEAIISVPENRKITEDFGRRTVLDLTTADQQYENHMIPTERLFDMLKWYMGYVGYWQNNSNPHPVGDANQFFEEFNDSIAVNFSQYDLPVIELAKETPKEAVCTVFEKVNTGGVTLNVFELVTAAFAAESDDFSLRDDWDARRKRMYDKYSVLRGIQGDQFLQAVALLNTLEKHKNVKSDGQSGAQVPAVGCKKRDILNLNLKDYLRWADLVEKGFGSAAKFMHRQFVFERRNVPYSTQLIPLAVLYVELASELEPAIARERLEHWFWSGIFGEVYGSAIETQFALDLIQVSDYVRYGTKPTLIDQASFAPERLLTLRTRNSAAYKGLYALQMKHGAADWKTGNPLVLMTYHDEKIDIHHVFPKAWASSTERSISPKLYDSIINKTPIDAKTNRMIGGRAPSIYVPELKSKMNPKLDDMLLTHWFDPGDLVNDDFSRSFVRRGEALLRLIGSVMGRDLGSGRTVFEEQLHIYLEPDAHPVPDEAFEDEEEFDDAGENGLLGDLPK